MEMTSVSSSNIDSVGFDPQTGELVVRFNNGNEYSYAGVPQETYDALMSASSIGSAFHSLIRSNYTGVRQ